MVKRVNFLIIILWKLHMELWPFLLLLICLVFLIRNQWLCDFLEVFSYDTTIYF
jgi:hypothetical protein